MDVAVTDPALKKYYGMDKGQFPSGLKTTKGSIAGTPGKKI
jgi:hypothetical protein